MAQQQPLRFDVEPPSRFANVQAAIRRPRVSDAIHLGILSLISQEITYFSYDENHEFRHDASSLRYYYPPSLPCDLSKGFDTFRQLDDTADDHLDGLLESITAYEKEKGSKVETDIITWRGMMTKV